MEYQLNPKIAGLEPYEPISGEYRIRLDANESYLPLPQEVREKMAEAVGKLAFNRYPDPFCKDLCAAFASYYEISSDLVTPGNGSDELISILMTAFLMKGEKVLTIEPDFSMYRFYASLAEVECVSLTKNSDFRICVDSVIEKSRQNAVRMIIFSNPCNPTGQGLPREEVRRLIASVDALVVLDEAYMDFWDQSLLQEVEQYDNLVILRTCSKAVGSAAIRLGFAVANPTLTKALRAVKSPYNVNSLTQQMGTHLFSCKKEMKILRNRLFFSRDMLYNGIKALEAAYPGRLCVYPTCTNFVFLKTGEAKRIYDYFLKNGVAIRIMGEYLRITAGEEFENNEVFRLLDEILKK